MPNNFTVRLAITVQVFSSARITDIAFIKVGGVALPENMHNVYLRKLLGHDDYQS